MRKIFDIAWNDIRLEFAYPITLIFFLVLPLAFTGIIGAGLSAMYASDDSDDDDRFPVVVVDEDASDLSAELISALSDSDVIRPVHSGEDEAAAHVIIPAGFEERLLAGETVELTLRKRPDDNRALAVEQEVRAAAGQVSNAVAAALVSLAEAERIRPFESEAARQAYFQQGLAAARQVAGRPPARLEVRYPPETDIEIAGGFEQSSAGQLVTWVNITLLGAAEVFVAERLEGTLRRMLLTPTRKATLLIGKILSRLCLGVIQMAILIGFGALLLGVNWGRSPLALALVALAYSLASVALGILLATFVKTLRQASGMVIFISMVTSAMGGAWWPLEVTPPAYQSAVRIVPATWAMIGFTDVIVRGQGVAGVLPEVGAMVGFALAFFVIGVWRLRYE